MLIWFLSFESKDTVKVGGLAEVPPRLGEALVKKGHKVQLLIPSHGFIREKHDKLEHIMTIEALGHRIVVYRYDKPVVEHIIFSSNILDQPEVYSPKYMYSKVIEWAISVKAYAEKLLGEGIAPDIVHGNDWHSIPSMIVLNNLYYISKCNTRFYYQIHLLSRTIFELKEVSEAIGLDPLSSLKGYYGVKTIKEYYLLANGYADRIGGLISDKLLTVSKNYTRDVIKRTGFDLEDHVDYIPNATTWNIPDLLEYNRRLHPEISNKLLFDEIIANGRKELRKYLLLHGLEKICENEPVIEDRSVREYIEKLDWPPFKEGGRVESFTTDGPLIISTGRLARQKGVHILLRGIEDLIMRVPEIRIVLFLLPVWSDKKLLDNVIEAVLMFRENLRVVFGKVYSIYSLAHLATNIMLAPSIYEPFGLMALEAMAAGAPVVASKVGGLAETVVDITRYGGMGTGLHVEPGDHRDLVEKTADLVLFMETQYYKPWSKEWVDLVERIDNKVLKELLLSNPEIPLLIRRSCIKRAEEYNWEASAEKALKIYTGG